MVLLSLLSTLSAAEFEIAAGAVKTPAFKLESGRVAGRAVFGAGAVELGVKVNPLPARASDLEEILPRIAGYSGAGYQQPIRGESVAGQLLGEIGFVPLQTDGLNGGLHIQGGLELARIVESYGTIDDGDQLVIEEGSTWMRPAACAGFGINAWYEDRVGLRVGWTERVALEPTPQYDPDQPVDTMQLHRYPMTSVELVGRLP